MTSTTDDGISVVLRLIADGFKAELNTAAGAVRTWATGVTENIEQVEEKAGGLSQAFAAAAEFFAAEKIIGGLKEMAIAAAEATDAFAVMGRVAENLGHAFNSAHAEAFVDTLATTARGAGAPIAELQVGLQQLISVTNTQSQAQRALEIAVGLSAARHINLGEAVQVVERVLTGHVALLSRYGIASKDAAGHTLTTAAAMESLARLGRDAGAIVGEGLPGQLGILNNELALLERQFGEVIAGALVPLIHTISQLVEWFRGLSPEAIAIIEVVGGLAAAFLAALAAASLFAALQPALIAGFALLTGPIGETIAIITAFVVLIVALATHWSQTMDVLQSAWKYAQSAIHSGIAFVQARLHDLGEMLTGVGMIFHQFGDVARSVWSAIVRTIETAVRFVGDRLNDVDAALGGTGNAFADLQTAVATVVRGIVQLISAMVTAATSLLDGLAQRIGSIVSTVTGAVTGFAGAASNVILAHMDPQMRAGLQRVVDGARRFGSGMAAAGHHLGSSIATGFKTGLAGIEALGIRAFQFARNVFTHHAVGGSSHAAHDSANVRFDNVPDGKTHKQLKPTKEKQAKDTSQKSLADVLTDKKAEIQVPLDAAALAVEHARVALERASIAAARFKDSLPNGKPTTMTEAGEEQRHIVDEISRAQDIQTELLKQKAALLSAARAEDVIAARLPAHDKQRVVHHAELAAQSARHRAEAEKTQLAYEQTGASIERFVRTLDGPMKAVYEHMKTAALRW